MKIVLAILMIITVGGAFGSGVFLVESPETHQGLLVLTEAELSWKAGGNVYKGKHAQKWTNGSGNIAVCNDVSNCPQGNKLYNIPRARCNDCTSNAKAYRHGSGKDGDKYATKLTTWCDDFGLEGVKCLYKESFTNYVHQCTIPMGKCP